ncbi:MULTISPECIES: lipopolysaccharide heptosyltransferase II [unclassified Pseudodesulfovibrio]|uniref:lipopolysaccharide heptosyltransferase II n=1 Tax=unclassified Pseudodesulfovibrio TaxID=2661612 RepID=UPI000FEC07BC|nr:MULTISPECIES: lipopolysaccharide heptosyltransferase II [unclassified Pseudodesulfovibrio]MCJ2165439.1 lipopolysaccharide heptosyltransferase II [Pseudodesulfovibrio sp. S3-i]RWU03189.1 lipopolysaccharide heptosyltransferase II [Pseudodesulfovibrio sp. S3]
MQEYKKIAVWQTAFLGDAVLTLPLLRALKDRFPGAEIHFFVRGGVESVFRGQPEIVSVRPFAKRGAQKSLNAAVRFGWELGREGFDLWISAHTSLRSALIGGATGIKRRIGYNRPWFNRLAYTETVDRRFSELEEIERLMELVRPLGIDGPAPEARLVLSQEAREAADWFWRTKNFDRPVLGIHPGSTWPTKCWPVEYFSEIVSRASSEGAHVLVFAGPGEEAVAARVLAEAQGDIRNVTNLAGQLRLPELAAYLGKLDCYLTNDSGPMHLAWTQGTPLVALFGPTVRSLGFFPRGENATVMETDLDCRPCGLHGPKVCPKGHFRCMKEVTPDLVWGELKAKLGL